MSSSGFGCSSPQGSKRQLVDFEDDESWVSGVSHQCTLCLQQRPRKRTWLFRSDALCIDPCFNAVRSKRRQYEREPALLVAYDNKQQDDPAAWREETLPGAR